MDTQPTRPGAESNRQESTTLVGLSRRVYPSTLPLLVLYTRRTAHIKTTPYSPREHKHDQRADPLRRLDHSQENLKFKGRASADFNSKSPSRPFAVLGLQSCPSFQ